MYSFNAVDALTALQMEIILTMRTYYNNNQKLYVIICAKEINFQFFQHFFVITTV